MNNQQAKLLLEKYNNGLASPEEIKLLENWYVEQSAIEQQDPEDEDYLQVKSEMWENIKTQKDKARTPYPWPRIVAAASILIFIGVGLYFYRSGNNQEQTEQTLAQHDFKPGSNKAILTLANGQQIVLTGAKNAEGQVVYNSGAASNSETIYNTMSTPLGGQYHLTLADGTGVWLNAASSIKYPTAFNGKDRQVEITGEAYFEVAHNAAKPFKVVSNGQTVQVLGTHFNINAYNDEANTKTTLLQGSVKVSANGIIKTITPGQQTAVSQTGIKLKNVDVDEIVAWKDGYFDFTDSDIKTIMRQFSRWYDVDIQFDGPVTTETFTGRIPRTWNLSQVMKIVESSKSVHLSVKGRRVMVKL